MKITNRYTGAVIIEGEFSSMSAAVSEAIKQGKNLRSANLSYADLSSANLGYADLRSADLSSANLRSANLSYADLRSANLRSANVAGTCFSIRVVTFGPFGTQRQITLFRPACDEVKSGCWSGNLAEFKLKVAELFEKGTEDRLLFDAGIKLFDAAAKSEKKDPKPDKIAKEEQPQTE